MAAELYRDADASFDDRLDDLLGRMNLDEKLAQIGSIWLTQLVRGDRFDADYAAHARNEADFLRSLAPRLDARQREALAEILRQL